MADWFKPVFSRSKTPIPLAPSDRASSFSNDESSEDGAARLRPISRVSSYMGFRPSTPVLTAAQAPDTYIYIREPESVYYKPSVDQIAETLKVVVMNQSSTTPIPVEYNSCVLHVLEAYQGLREELTKRDIMITQLESSHASDIEDFEKLAAQWESKEDAYKVDLKRVEVLLSQTEGGMEKVTMARSTSVVHGTKTIGKEIRREIGTIKQRKAQHSRGMLMPRS